MNKNVERDWMTVAKRKIAYVNLFHYLKTTSTQLEQKLSPQCNMLQSRPAKIRWIVDAIKCQIFAAVGCLLLQILSVRFSFTRHRNVIFNCSFAFNPQIALAPLRGVSHCRSGKSSASKNWEGLACPGRRLTTYRFWVRATWRKVCYSTSPSTFRWTLFCTRKCIGNKINSFRRNAVDCRASPAFVIKHKTHSTYGICLNCIYTF